MEGTNQFERYYAEVFGERWEPLRNRLLAPVESIHRLNGFVSSGIPRELRRRFGGIENEFLRATAAPPETLESGLSQTYQMDLASVIVAEALAVESGDRVLDMCAAPGGKALILAERLADSGALVLNDISKARRHRLLSVLKSYVPEDALRRIRVTGHDATRWGLHERDEYDRILLDAPCSSERHVLGSEQALRKWTPARTRQLAQRQYSLLCSALLAVRPGGRIVYSTCSILPNENEGVVQKLLKRKSGVACANFQSPMGERTEWGWMILPNEINVGPIYVCVLEKAKS